MLKSLEKHIQNLVVVLLVASYFELFCFSAIPYSIRVVSQPIMLGIIVVLIILKIIYNPRVPIKMNFAGPIAFLFISSFPSVFIAYSFHNQSVIGSLWASKLIFFYLLYFYLHVYKIQARFLLRLLIIVGLLAVLFYYLQFSLYPRKIFSIRMLEERGTIRLFIAGMLCTPVAYFYFLNEFFKKNRTIYLVFTLLCLSIFILQGTRQFIFALAFLTFINFVVFRRMRSRFLIFFAVACSVVFIYLTFHEIFNELTKVSSSQASNMSEGIRLKAAKFYLTTFMPGKLAYIFGNGQSALGSQYSLKMMLYSTKYGFVTSDIGIIGDYVSYGIIFTIAGIVMLIKSYTFKVSPEYRFLKYYIFFQSFTMIAGMGIFGGVDIVLLCILYIFDCDRATVSKKPVESQAETEESAILAEHV